MEDPKADNAVIIKEEMTFHDDIKDENSWDGQNRDARTGSSSNYVKRESDSDEAPTIETHAVFIKEEMFFDEDHGNADDIFASGDAPENADRLNQAGSSGLNNTSKGTSRRENAKKKKRHRSPSSEEGDDDSGATGREKGAEEIKKKERKPPRKKIPDYHPDRMKEALDDVKSGMPVATAAKKHGVPRGTLKDKVNGRTPEERRMGPAPVLKKDGEEEVVQWILAQSRAGFPVRADQVLDSVQKIIQDLPAKANKFNFVNNRPGRTWLRGFLKRNPSISKRVTHKFAISRTSVTSEQLKIWVHKIYEYLMDNGLETILDDPARVFNGDEIAFFLNPKGSKVLAPKGDKTIYQPFATEKQCLTVLITANAAGSLAPPLIVFKYERIPADLAASVPSHWGFGKSETGWVNSALFYEYTSSVFHPWLLREKIEKPVILFVDGHSSHLTLQTSEFCSKNGIILLALYPNATHLIQPMDVAVFRYLEERWQKKVHEWKLRNLARPMLRSIHFCRLLEEVLSDVEPSIIQNGFKACGLVPWNPAAMKNSLDNSSQTDTDGENVDGATWQSVIALRVLEAAIGEEKLNLFKRSETWNGPIEDDSLFNVWRMMENNASGDATKTGDQGLIENDTK